MSAQENQIVNNLIDLTIDETACPPLIALHTLPPQLIINDSGRDSLDNNPFDRASKLAFRFNDPFEIVPKEHSPNSACFVRTANLITIENNGGVNCKTTKKEENVSAESNNANNNEKQLNHSSRTDMSSVSSFQSMSPIFSDFSCRPSDIADSQNTMNKGFDMNAENSTNIISNSDMSSDCSNTLNKAFLTSNISLPVSSRLSDKNHEQNKSESANNLTAKAKRTYSNPDVQNYINKKNSPIADLCKSRSNSLDQMNRNKLLKFSLKNSKMSSKIKNKEDTNDSVFIDANDSFDDIMSTSTHWIDSENDADSDLDQSKFPYLKKENNEAACSLEEIEKNEVVAKNSIKHLEVVDQFKKYKAQHTNSVTSADSSSATVASEKSTNTPQSLSDTSQNSIEKVADFSKNTVEILMNQVEEEISKCDDPKNKERATILLKNLNDILGSNKLSEENIDDNLAVPPTPIVRQGTFNIDEEKENSSKNEKEKSANELNEKSTIAVPTEDHQNIVNMVNQMLAGNAGFNVSNTNLQSVITTNAAASGNPTYIVVVGTPIVNKGRHNSPDSNDSPSSFLRTNNFRSKSMSLAQKPSAVKQALQAKQDFTTPMRPMNRRSSFSQQMSANKQDSVPVRRSIYASPAPNNRSPSPLFKQTPKKNTVQESKPGFGKSTKQALPFNNKLKVRVGQSTKLGGPMKATIPVKKVAPLIVTKSVSSPISAEKKHLITSTPISSSNVYPKACSTPMGTPMIKVIGCNSDITPPLNGSFKPPASKLRQSYLSATPNPKSGLLGVGGLARRRTLTDSKLLPKRTDRTSSGTKTVSFLQRPKPILNKENKVPNNN